jgi:uncharacterized protein (TIGR02391 family)
MSSLGWFERVVRRAATAAPKVEEPGQLHPFDERNIHPEIAKVARGLFDNAHYPQATFEAFKYIDNEVQRISMIGDTGFALMMEAFNEKKAAIKLTNISNMSETDEQRGYRHVFAGGMAAIRNPRGHTVNPVDPIQMCLDHLSFASMLMRRLDDRLHPAP